jgi:protein SSD1
MLPQQQQQQDQSNGGTSTRKSLYPAHLTVSEASAAIRARNLFSGILCVDAQDSSEAFVECEELDGASIYIFGSRNRNRALDGDEVAIELVNVDDMLHEKQSKRQARHTRRLSCISSNNSAATTLSSSHPTLSSIPEDEFFNLSVNRPRPKYCGKVVCILERPRNMLFSG